MLFYAVYTLHILVSLFLILVVLVQSGKGGDLSMFTSGGSQTAFGPAAGATLFTKLTTWSAIIFMVTSITLSIHSARASASGGSVLSGEKQGTTQPAPSSAPAPAAPAQSAPTAPTKK